MKKSVRVIFGKEEVEKYISDIPLSSDELHINSKEYFFDTEIELIAFRKGINEAVGWQEIYMIEE